MLLKELCDIKIGGIVSRMKPINNENEVVDLELLQVQHFDYVFGKDEQLPNPKHLKLSKDKVESFIADRNQVIIDLTSGKAIVISTLDYDEKSETNILFNKFINSNFVILEIRDDLIIPWYLAWIINEYPKTKKELFQMRQGSVLEKISVNLLGNLEIKVIKDRTIQKAIAGLYWTYLYSKRKKIKLQSQYDLYINAVISNLINKEEDAK